MTTFSNLKTYLLLELKNLFGCHFKILWKKRNDIVTFQSGQLMEWSKTLDCFDLKIFRNCLIRIKIITGSHIFILFLPWVGTLKPSFYPLLPLEVKKKIGIKFQPVVKTI
jgi:hypothetical protein